MEIIRDCACDVGYIRFGSGSRTFVILPGLSIGSVLDSADQIAEAYEPFTEDYTVYLFDRKNTVPENYNIEQMADDTAAAMEAAGLHDADLFGASQGGMIGQIIAANHPELVHKLVLGSSVTRVDGHAEEVVNNWLDLAARREGVRLLLDFGEKIYPKEVFDQFKSGLKLIGEKVSDEELDRFITLATAAKGFDMTGRLSLIKCPVFAIGSRDDKVFGPEALKDLEQAFEGRPDFESYYYDGYGHAAFDTAPDYKQRILAFLNH